MTGVLHDHRHCYNPIELRPVKNRRLRDGFTVRERALPALGVTHAMHTDGLPDPDIVHALRRDEDVLLPLTRVGRIDL